MPYTGWIFRVPVLFLVFLSFVFFISGTDVQHWHSRRSVSSHMRLSSGIYPIRRIYPRIPVDSEVTLQPVLAQTLNPVIAPRFPVLPPIPVVSQRHYAFVIFPGTSLALVVLFFSLFVPNFSSVLCLCFTTSGICCRGLLWLPSLRCTAKVHETMLHIGWYYQIFKDDVEQLRRLEEH